MQNLFVISVLLKTSEVLFAIVLISFFPAYIFITMSIVKTLSEAYKEQFLQAIPSTEALGIEIEKIMEKEITLKAPLDNNINYEGTAFGGSLNTVAILSCYILVHHLLKINKIPFKSLVIQNSKIQYLKPVQNDFIATAKLPGKGKTQRFLQSIQKRGIGRIGLESNINIDQKIEKPLVIFNGRFVVTV